MRYIEGNASDLDGWSRELVWDAHPTAGALAGANKPGEGSIPVDVPGKPPLPPGGVRPESGAGRGTGR